MRQPTYPARREVDPVKVDRALHRRIPARQLTTAERIAAVRALTCWGHSDERIADQLGWCTGDAVRQFRRFWGIPAGRREAS